MRIFIEQGERNDRGFAASGGRFDYSPGFIAKYRPNLIEVFTDRISINFHISRAIAITLR
jgi:hypothetical protein